MSSEHEVGFGIILHTFGDHTSPDAFRRIARVAEDKGFDAIWVGDHITFPDEIPSEYPFSPTNEPPEVQHISSDLYDTFNVISFLANETDEIKLGTNTCIVPYRHPIVLAKNALTVDALSEGRFVFGVGTGWMSTEFDVLEISFGERGSRTDEFLELFQRACREGEIAFEGPHHSFPKTGFYPAPHREEGPPLLVGGYSGPAFRRTAEFGDGWTIYGLRPEKVESGYERLMNAWEDYDRQGTPDVVAARSVHVGTETSLSTDRPLVGAPEKIVNDIGEYTDAGVTDIAMDFYTLDIEEQIDQLKRFGDEVVSEFK